MYSAYLALKVKNSSVVLCNGDVVVEKEMVKDCWKTILKI